MCNAVPGAAPGRRRRPRNGTESRWGPLHRHVLSTQAREMLDMALAGIYTSAARRYRCSGRWYSDGVRWRTQLRPSNKGGSQDAACTAEWERSRTRWPRNCWCTAPFATRPPDRPDDDGVTVHSGDDRAGGAGDRRGAAGHRRDHRVRADAAGGPMDVFHQRMPGGAVMKTSVLYDSPFWRADGLCGQSAAPDPGHPDDRRVHRHGRAGRPLRDHRGSCRPRPREARRRRTEIRRHRRTGGPLRPQAAAPAGYHEQDWTLERYSGGGMISHAPPGC